MIGALKRAVARSARTGRGVLANVKQRLKSRDAGPEIRIGNVHALENNPELSQAQYDYCVTLAGQIQKLYDGVIEYIDSEKLDRALFLPGNEWVAFVPTTGIRFRTTYNDINYLRLAAPFSGYHLPILDRVDQSRFPSPWAEEFITRLATQGIPDDIAAQVRSLYDPEARLRPCIDEYVDHIRNVPSRYIVDTPRFFGEVGIEVNGNLANPDVILCQSRINGMLCSGLLDKLDNDIARKGKARIVEVGSGHGGLAYALKSIFGDNLEYVCIDLPSSLYHATLYLSTLANGDGCYVHKPHDPVPDRFNYLFVANYCVDEIADALAPVDVALNAMSFPEMTVEQVRYYGEFFKKVLGDDGVVFEENGVISPSHTDIKKIFAEIFPFRKKVTSNVLTTKNWCQDVWSSRFLEKVFKYDERKLLRR